MTIRLHYTGGGYGGAIGGIPARDLTEQEVNELGGAQQLIATGLYEDVKPVEEKPKRAEPRRSPHKGDEE